ncbi:MAG: hypothetical protein RL199_847 [Pseudomonadota bacterium]|jgi:thiamine-phosphate pyrophosphorylase
MSAPRLEGLYGIAGPPGPGPFERRRQETLALARALLSADAAVVQLRDKWATGAELHAVACELKSLLKGRSRLVVNDRLDVALTAGADGVHLGQDDLDAAAAVDLLTLLGRREGFLVGLSTHSEDEVRCAAVLGVDYVGFGPVFATSTKADAQPVRGLDRLASAVRVAGPLPVVAIGGLGRANVAAAARAGASMVAVISDVQDAPDPAVRAAEVQRAFRSARV